MPESFSDLERQQLLSTRLRALEQYEKSMVAADAAPPLSSQESAALNEAQMHFAGARHAEESYFSKLPRLTLSRCPFDDKPLVRTFDRFGLDGPWWRSDATPQELPTCPHFCFLRGALNFNGRRAHGGDFEAHTGPEAPYVLPHVLSKPGVIAVLSQVEMSGGYLVYFMAYFAERRPAAAELASNFPKTFYTYTTGMGPHRWQFETQPWDFELTPWLEQKKIRWCRPGDVSALAEGPASGCPYAKISGKRERMVVGREAVWSIGLAKEGLP